MSSEISTKRFFAIGLVLLIAYAACFSQSSTNWLRVSTGDDSVLEVDRDSLNIAKQAFIAKFRTKFEVPEKLSSNSSSTYIVREDQIEFSSEKYQYRVAKSDFYDESGKNIRSVLQPNGLAWKSVYGRTGSLMYRAIDQLRPFGQWTIKSYRFASGETASKDDEPELKELVGSVFTFKRDQIRIGKDQCSPNIEPRTITNADYESFSREPLAKLGISADKIDTIRITCSRSNRDPLLTYILKFSNTNALLLWDGVFLKIERPANSFAL